MKSSHLLISALVGAIVMVGCGGGETADEPDDTAPEPTEDEAPDDGAAVDDEDDEWAAIVEAAREEGQVTWYTIAPQASQQGLQAAFAEAYPEIELEIRTMTLAEMEAALESERDTGAEGADVVTGVNYEWILDRADEGWWIDMVGPSVELPGWQDSDYLLDDQILQAPLGLIVLAWNTSQFDESIDGYEDLLDPRFAGGTIGMARAEPAIHADYWAFLEDTMGEDFLEEFAAQEPMLYPSAFALQEALAAGEVAIGGFVSATDMVGLQDQGAPIEFTVPDPAWTVPNWFFGVEWSDNPNATQVFLDFVASPEGQLAAAEQAFSPLEEVAPQTLGADSNVSLADVDRMLEEGWYEDFNAQWQELFDN